MLNMPVAQAAKHKAQAKIMAMKRKFFMLLV
jgi:hypothetical protein